jgi:putative YhbY family RNA-binding protein
MEALTPAQRRELRAKAHHVHPVVIVGQHGLTPAVLHEIDVNLLAHGLIKVRVFSEDRGEREAMLERICAALDAASVQHIGRLLVLWRPAPDKMEAAPPETRATSKDRRIKSGTGKAKTMAKSTPQARRPRSPLARTTARSATPRAPSSKTRQPSAQARRRRQGS